MYDGPDGKDSTPRSARVSTSYTAPLQGNTVLSLFDCPDLEDVDCSSMGLSPDIYLGGTPNLTNIALDPELRQTSKGMRHQCAAVHFLDIPEQPVLISGHLRDITVKEGLRVINSGMGTNLHVITRLEPAHNGIVCRDVSDLQNAPDCEYAVVVLRPESGERELVVGEGSNLRHLGVVGPSDCERLVIHSPLGSERIVVKQMPKLKHVVISGSTKILEMWDCANLRSIDGFGNHLLVRECGTQSNINVDGMWLNVPESTSMRTVGLTLDRLRHCQDLAGVNIVPREYETLCNWSETLDVGIEEISDGISIPDLVQKLMKGGPEVFEQFSEWFEDTLMLQEQYYGMRIISALANLGFPGNQLWAARNAIQRNNMTSSKMTTRSTDSLVMTSHFRWELSKMNRPRSQTAATNSETRWMVPIESYVPFHRLDVEVWIHCQREMDQDGNPPPSISELLKSGHSHFWSRAHRTAFPGTISASPSAIMVATVMDAVRSNRTSESAQSWLEQLFTNVMESLRNTGDPRLFDALAHCFMAEPDGNEMVALVETIVHSRIQNWEKAALLFGIAQRSTDIRIMVSLAALTSQNDISREESRDINLVATCGQRAFIKNRVEGLEWPFIDSWRNRHDR